eukprot:1156039-Pelagomonas_calceolata.AAC.2
MACQHQQTNSKLSNTCYHEASSTPPQASVSGLNKGSMQDAACKTFHLACSAHQESKASQLPPQPHPLPQQQPPAAAALALRSHLLLPAPCSLRVWSGTCATWCMHIAHRTLLSGTGRESRQEGTGHTSVLCSQGRLRAAGECTDARSPLLVLQAPLLRRHLVYWLYVCPQTPA